MEAHTLTLTAGLLCQIGERRATQETDGAVTSQGLIDLILASGLPSALSLFSHILIPSGSSVRWLPLLEIHVYASLLLPCS